MSNPEPADAPTSTFWWLLCHLNPRWVLRTYRNGFALLTLLALFFVVLLWDEIVIPIGSGEKGVYWSRFFGGTLDWDIGEGTFLKLPWDKIIVYNVRHQAVSDKTILLSVDGMALEIDWYLRFRPSQQRLPELHQTYGPDYGRLLIVPEVVSVLRRVIGNFRADQIYAEDEGVLLDLLFAGILKRMNGQPVILDSMQIMRLNLPEKMASSIVAKLMEEQKHLSYKFKILAETQEANRKELEANGLRRFREISGVDPLKWRGVEATVQLAQSPNTKIVIVGTGAKQLPLLLNADPTPVTQPVTGPIDLPVPDLLVPMPKGEDAGPAPPQGR